MIDGGRRPKLSWQSWWNGTYQDSLARHCNDSVGFRADLIRTVNQLNFSVFGNMNSAGVVEGKRNNLFWGDYINSYCGSDYKGDDYPIESLWKLKKIQDTLERLGKTFVLVHSGSKASYFCDDIPATATWRADGKNNLKNYVRIADSLGIHQVDLNSWIAALRYKKPHHLFNKQGIHWNLYGAYFAADSIISYIEQRRNIRMPHPRVVKIDRSYKPRNKEDDIEMVLNLIYPVDTTAYWYPDLKYDDDTTLAKPKVIYIGDSFISPLLADGLFNSNTDPEYWFYFRLVIFKDWENEHNRKEMKDYNWQEAIGKADCIVMAYTITQLVDASPLFIDQAYDYYYPGASKKENKVVSLK